MLLGIVSCQSVSSVENLVTDNAVVRHSEVDLCVSLATLLGLKEFATGQTLILPQLCAPYQAGHQRVEI